jgi:hypothetical protein
MPSRILIALILILFVMASPFTAMAEPKYKIKAAPIGTIISLEGAATITTPSINRTSDIKQGMSVFLDDIIQTDASSKVLLLLIDDTQVTLSENAMMTVDEYIFDAAQKDENRARFSILRGAFLFVSGMMTKNSTPKVRLDTKYGSIGVRGTTLWSGELDMNADYRANSRIAMPKRQYAVFVSSGEVLFTTEAGDTKIEEGEGSLVRNINASPSYPEKWSSYMINQAIDNVSMENVDEINELIEAQQQNHEKMRQDHVEEIELREEALKEEQINNLRFTTDTNEDRLAREAYYDYWRYGRYGIGKQENCSGRLIFLPESGEEKICYNGSTIAPNFFSEDFGTATLNIRAGINNILQFKDDRIAIEFCAKYSLPCRGNCARMPQEEVIWACESNFRKCCNYIENIRKKMEIIKQHKSE